ncbi:hypothetical protein C8R44DRAFT_850891 [Mycena epipterygia]|nr:hypothetical protein C8R44DRAFT_850891 [Mycena epipterygia]
MFADVSAPPTRCVALSSSRARPGSGTRWATIIPLRHHHISSGTLRLMQTNLGAKALNTAPRLVLRAVYVPRDANTRVRRSAYDCARTTHSACRRRLGNTGHNGTDKSPFTLAKQSPHYVPIALPLGPALRMRTWYPSCPSLTCPCVQMLQTLDYLQQHHIAHRAPTHHPIPRQCGQRIEQRGILPPHAVPPQNNASAFSQLRGTIGGNAQQRFSPTKKPQAGKPHVDMESGARIGVDAFAARGGDAQPRFSFLTAIPTRSKGGPTRSKSRRQERCNFEWNARLPPALALRLLNAHSGALYRYSDLSTTESTGGAVVDFWASGEQGYVCIMGSNTCSGRPPTSHSIPHAPASAL